MGKPGFLIPPPGRRVWEGYALPGSMFIVLLAGRGMRGTRGCAEAQPPRIPSTAYVLLCERT